MGRFNLLDEPWISVMTDHKGTTKEVSIIELLTHAHEYKQLAGEMVTQDFATFRFLVAILHTVFSRLDASGEPYQFLELDEKYQQLGEVDEDDGEGYRDALFDTWLQLWENGEFPPILIDYLKMWHDRFYLFDEQYPFFQVTKTDIAPERISKSAASPVAGKNINRLISESGNKLSLFSPKSSVEGNKNQLSNSEVARWLLTFQGYTGLSDKVIFGKEKYKASKGWLFDIGGVVVKGKNFYETLLLNCVLDPEETPYSGTRQRPCWEVESSEVLERLFSLKTVTNSAELYTNWSRAIYMDSEMNPGEKAEIQIVKVPELDHRDNFLEPMTLWRYNVNGDNRGKYTPRKHNLNVSVWRSFGLLTLPNSTVDSKEQRKPGVMDWLGRIKDQVGDNILTVQAITMKDDGNATSWVPVDEIVDSMNINNFVLTDVLESGWIPRINEAIDLTKDIVDKTYRRFMMDIKEIRSLSSNDFVGNKVEELYFSIDQPFRNWLSDLRSTDEKDEEILMWMGILKKLVLDEAEKMVSEAGPRDFAGIVIDNKTKNIATAYNSFLKLLNIQLP